MSNLIKAVAFIRSIDWTIIRVDVFDKGKQVNLYLFVLDNIYIYIYMFNFNYQKLYEDDIELVIKKIQSNKPRQDERNKL